MSVSYNSLVGSATYVPVLVVPQRDAFKLHSDRGRRLVYCFITPDATWEQINFRFISIGNIFMRDIERRSE
jgi:hypothetical protein